MSSLGHGGVDHHRAEVCGIRGGFGGRDGWGGGGVAGGVGEVKPRSSGEAIGGDSDGRGIGEESGEEVFCSFWSDRTRE